MTTDKQEPGTRTQIDWDAVKQRLKQNELALEKALVVDEERILRTFHERAELLAARTSETDKIKEKVRLLVFRLWPERYGIELQQVTQVVPFSECAPVPESPPQLLGVTNLRGHIRSVVDLRRLLELPESQGAPRGYILFVRNGDEQVGFRVDEIENVQSVDRDNVTLPTEESIDLPASYLTGITPERIIILNTEELFEHPLF